MVKLFFSKKSKIHCERVIPSTTITFVCRHLPAWVRVKKSFGHSAMIFSDCQLKCLAEMHSFWPHMENTSYFISTRAQGHIFSVFYFCVHIIVFYRVVKSVGGVSLLYCLLIKCKYYNLVLCLQLYRNYIMVVVIATREFNNVQTRSR